MQQVAAHKTDIAALPFSASGTAKAVGTSIGTQQEANSENNQAFNRLYQEAKSSKSEIVLNEKSYAFLDCSPAFTVTADNTEAKITKIHLIKGFHYLIHPGRN